MNILAAKSIQLTLSGRLILNSVSCNVPNNKTTVILGPNGAGKTMLLRCLAGLQQTQNGQIDWLGLDHGAQPEKTALALHRAWVPLSHPLPFDFKVLDLVTMNRFPHHKGFPGSLDLEKALYSLELLGIQHLSPRSYNTLSRGEQTKVDIAKAIAQDVPLIFLDEPFANLDIDAKLQISGVFDILRKQGKTLILSHHDLYFVPRIADYIIYLKDGAKVAEGNATEMFQEHHLESVFNVKVRLDPIPNSLDFAISFNSSLRSNL